MKKSRTKRIFKDTGNYLIIAIDIGKATHYVYWCDCFGRDGQSVPFHNNREGFERLWRIIVDAKAITGVTNVVVGYESTASYWIPLAHFLSEKPVTLVQVNPMHTKRVKELDDNSPLKSDRKDPRVIATLIRLGHWLSVVIPKGAAAELRQLSHARERGVEDMTVAVNRLRQAMDVLFPEFGKIMGFSSVTARYLLRHYPNPQSLLELDENELTALITKISRKQLGEERARKLRDAASHTIGIKEGMSAFGLEINHLLDTLEQKESYIQSLEAEMNKYLRHIPCAEILLSIKGIGTVIAAGILGEIGDFRAYPTQASLLKMAGLSLYEVSSGIHQGTRHITKRGRSKLRKYLFSACTNMIRKGGIFYESYQARIARGKHTFNARVALMRKLLIILYALVRDGVAYNAKHRCEQAA